MGKKQKWWDRLDFVTRNITASMDATDADVRDLTDNLNALRESMEKLTNSMRKLLDMQESMKSISKTHTLWLDRLSRRVRDLEDRLSPPSESTEASFVHCRAKETSPGAVSKTVAAVSAPGEDLIDFGLWLSEELTGRPISRADLESCLSDWKASR